MELESSSEPEGEAHHQWVDTIPDTAIEIRVPAFARGSAYNVYNVDARVDKILRRYKRSHQLGYLVRVKSGHEYEVSFKDLLHIPGGFLALKSFHEHISDSHSSRSSGSEAMVTTRGAHPKRQRDTGFVDSSHLEISDDDGPILRQARPQRSLRQLHTDRPILYEEQPSTSVDTTSDGDSSDAPRVRNTRSRRQDRRLGRNSRVAKSNYIDHIFDESSGSDKFHSKLGKRKRDSKPSRRSERTGRHAHSMKERVEEDIPEVETRGSSRGAQKVVGAKEIFMQLPLSDEFRNRHFQDCETCRDFGDSKEKGHLVFCQGCTMSYHKTCLGARNSREHLVTKVGPRNFVLQCRRCVASRLVKEPLAPNQGRCQDCGEIGVACRPFSSRKTPKEEQKEREENDGEDPVVPVPNELINNARNVMFRCVICHRAWHIHHLPAKSEKLFESADLEQKTADRWAEYCQNWECHECSNVPAPIGALIAWRPTDLTKYSYGDAVDDVPEDEKEYLVKWANKSYTKSLWMPGSWVWDVASDAMKRAFAKRDNQKVLPKMRTEDAIPEEYLRVDIVFQVKYNNVVADRIEEVDLARIREVEQAQVKFKGLDHEDVVWEEPPDPVQEPERWADFKTAYEDWVRGRYVRAPPSSTLSNNLRKVKALDFQKDVLLKEQPKSLTGGKLMEYQLDGLNWIYYKWHSGHNAILADEMGLGKTIQVIGFLATLQEKHHCWPSLIVVPNSTCANWKREIRTWAPSLRVVTYFGSAKAKELSEKYELFAENKKDLRCHVVVTSYDAAQDAHCQKILRHINWATLIVDEGQRLKNDKNILYGALSTLRTPFKLLLTGTPLQNNQRELFNLLQFLDSSIDAKHLAEKYETLTKDGVKELHEMLRPFFLRRTKIQVLDFLPTMAQIIIPVTMSSLQKELYKSILAKNVELLKSIFGADQKAAPKGGLRNILMQLRKCLCHPFVYNLGIEERSSEAIVTHRRLVEASAKLQLLEIMLPKLKERGHRVLIFSQFLDMLTIVEDFLEGLSLEHIRLDGSMDSLEKQRKIDKYNAPDSSVFAFLLSTRAGGVGINLASADTVIILDPDFNPHQDIQAISRAHRIGQKKKVLVLQIMTRGTAEEKIMQIGKKKMALDHVLIESMDEDDADGNDLESVLRFGAEALFKDDGAGDIVYDSASVDKLLDRTQIEDTKTSESKSAESQFSFARVWQNDSASLEDTTLANAEIEEGPSKTVWELILARRAEETARKNKEMETSLGRGKRQRRDVDYNGQKVSRLHELEEGSEEDDDTDFQAPNMSDEDGGSVGGDDDGIAQVAEELGNLDGSQMMVPQMPIHSRKRPAAVVRPHNVGQRPGLWQPLSQQALPSSIIPQHLMPLQSVPYHADPYYVFPQQAFPQHGNPPTVTRYHAIGPPPGSVPVQWPLPSGPYPYAPDRQYGSMDPSWGTSIPHSPRTMQPGAPDAYQNQQGDPTGQGPRAVSPCIACNWADGPHAVGFCPLKLAGAELCGLCGLAHFGYQRSCPHLNSETQIRLIQESLKHSPESKELISNARWYLNGIKGSLIQQKKRKAEKEEARRKAAMKTSGSSGTQAINGVDGSSRPELQEGHQGPTAAPRVPDEDRSGGGSSRDAQLTPSHPEFHTHRALPDQARNAAQMQLSQSQNVFSTSEALPKTHPSAPHATHAASPNNPVGSSASAAAAADSTKNGDNSKNVIDLSMDGDEIHTY